jgi:LPPG:FO 2-phospho-L-lactate transferase
VALGAKKITVMVGGVGGAKLALGLSKILAPEQLTIIVNTGDDFWHLGLRVCPDMDTVMYTLADVVNPEFGWGINGDTRVTLKTLQKHYGFEPWFGIGDKDIATHLLRTHLLREGQTLTQITEYLSKQIGLKHRLFPMTDSEVPTVIETLEYGELAFQEYFVKHRWQPTVKSIRFQNSESANMTSAVKDALESADIILIAPSNPWLSIAPILAIPDMRDLLLSRDVPRVVMTPIVGGQAIKGPAAKIMTELGLEVSSSAVAHYYGELINGFIDDVINPVISVKGLTVVQFDTIMKTLDDKVTLAQQVLEWIGGWGT